MLDLIKDHFQGFPGEPFAFGVLLAALSTFAVLVITLLLLTFMGDALRDALDPRKLHQETQP